MSICARHSAKVTNGRSDLVLQRAPTTSAGIAKEKIYNYKEEEKIAPVCVSLAIYKCVWSVVVITCSKKAPERVQAAAEYSPIISKHLTQINLSSPKKAKIRNG